MRDAYHLVTDASADLIPAFAEKEKIQVLPMTYMLDEEEYVSRGWETPEHLKWYYDGERAGKMTRTSQISPQVYADCFRAHAERGESVLYLSLSGGLSGTYNTARFVAREVMDEFPGVTVRCVDSRSATAGIQLLMEKLAENRSAGMDIEENAAWMEQNRLRLCHWFMVDDLMYLKRNGRISPATALVGAALNIKPILRIEDEGHLVNFAKKRGSKVALNQLVALYDQASAKESGERVYIVHADNEAGADYLEQAVRQINPGCVLSRAMLTPIIGCHTGPSLCAIVHFGRRIL